ncbi:MAG: DUF5666 domain-containing protein [Gammaproteobacteria bacterium]|jgi:hypothetical protein
MKILRNWHSFIWPALVATIPLVPGCGGSSSTGSSSEGETIVSRGVITGFGSIFVNGHEFETDDASFEVDDDSGEQDDLRIGMIVTVVGSHRDGVDYAEKVTYDNELKGPVSDIQIVDGNSKVLVILGQSVLVTRDTTIDDDGSLTYDTIALGDVLEVSAYVSDTRLIATHIEWQDNSDEIEIKGVIENFAAGSFEIRGFPVSYDSDTEIDSDIDTLGDGLFVEVHGQLNTGGTSLIAKEIEAEDEGIDDHEDEVEIKGIISAYEIATATFMLQGQKVDASSAKLEPATLVLDNDLLVEVEGHLVDGLLVADEIQLEDHHADD